VQIWLAFVAGYVQCDPCLLCGNRKLPVGVAPSLKEQDALDPALVDDPEDDAVLVELVLESLERGVDPLLALVVDCVEPACEVVDGAPLGVLLPPERVVGLLDPFPTSLGFEGELEQPAEPNAPAQSDAAKTNERDWARVRTLPLIGGT